MDPNAVRAVTDLGTIGLLLLTLIGGYRGWWVFGPQHNAIVKDLVEQRNFWRTQALRSTTLAEVAIGGTEDEDVA